MSNFWQQMLFWTLAVLIGLFVGIFWMPIILDASVSSNLMQTFLGTLAGAAIVTILNIFYQQQQDKKGRVWQQYLINLEEFNRKLDDLRSTANAIIFTDHEQYHKDILALKRKLICFETKYIDRKEKNLDRVDQALIYYLIRICDVTLYWYWMRHSKAYQNQHPEHAIFAKEEFIDTLNKVILLK